MIIITERRHGNELYFEKEVAADGKSVTTEIRYRTAVVRKGQDDYYMIYDAQMRVVSDAFGYVNFGMTAKSDNSRLKAQQALKLLFSFESIIGKRLAEFTLADIAALKCFLHGFSPKGQLYQFQTETVRSNRTVNSYLSIYRQFLSSQGIEESVLQKKRAVSVSTGSEYAPTPVKMERYEANEAVSQNPFLEVPMYVSVEEFKRIISAVRAHYDVRDEIIIRLMFQCGLRIGEVLGLTGEDVTMEKCADKYAAVAYIRNRITDSIDQRAKTCMNVYDRKQYAGRDYNTRDYGYQTVVLPQDLYDLLNDYIEERHVKARSSCSKDRYYRKAAADSVRGEEDNYYIFLNSIGTPLHSHTWNKRLRAIMTEADIPLDYGKREHNLNHRFRHGYAMFNVQYLNCKEVDLAERMRHRSVLSVYQYYRPTVSEQIKMKAEFAESLYEAVPELRREDSC